VLAKFFALDFSQTAFPLGAGRATSHHDIFAQIQRSGAEQFDLYVFRSFARAFWTALCHASEEVGYRVG
jgi:sarcosine oxidase subunit gamma